MLAADKEPAVSVIIPVYNRTATLATAVRSVLAQTFQDFEIIVIDDGSSEDIPAALADLKAPNLRLLKHPDNEGTAAARNTGIRHATGRYIAFLDSDDTWMPEKLDRQLKALAAADANTKACCTSFFLARDDGTSQERRTLEVPEDWYAQLLWGCDLSPGATLVVQRDCFEEIGPFDEGFRRLEDWDWLLRYAARYGIAVVEDPLARVNLASPPSAAEVEAALTRMREKHLATAAATSRRMKRRFQSTLLLENAAASYRERRLLRATALLMRSLLAYPLRNPQLYLRLAGHLFQPLSVAIPADLAETQLAPPRILHVITDLQTGGAEGMLSALVLTTPESQRPVAVVSLTRGGPYATLLREAGVRVADLGMGHARPNVIGLIRLIRLIRRLRPDTIQSWMYHADLIAAIAWLLSGRGRRSRLFWGIRCSDMDTRSYGWSLWLTIRVCALLSPLPDAVIANSEAGLNVHRRLRYRPRRFLVIDNGIDVRRFAPDPEARRKVREELRLASDEPVLAFVARVDPMKDYPCFLAAFRRVRGARALLIGYDTESLPEQPGLVRLGQRNDVPRLLAACDILVSSSAFGEGFSNAIAEGMATGLAPIATDVGDARRIIGEAGLIVPPRDPDALADAIQRLVDNDAERREFGRRARRRIVEHFSLERAVDAFARVHREARSRSSP